MISMPSLSTYIDLRTVNFFPTCWILIGQFKFPARQPYARKRCWRCNALILTHLHSKVISISQLGYDHLKVLSLLCLTTPITHAYERLIAELRWPEGPPSGVPYPYRKLKENRELIFSRLSRLAVLPVGAYPRRRWRRRRRWSRARWRPSSK